MSIWDQVTGPRHACHLHPSTACAIEEKPQCEAQKLNAHPTTLHLDVGSHANDDDPDPDRLDQAARMQLEQRAIELIIGLELTLRRTPEGNLGYDLYENNCGGQPIRWIEVKSMTGNLEDRPVGLSHMQFEYARTYGATYWLYVVEYATDPSKARMLKIQNLIAHARTFTFDRGWAEIARIEPPV